MSGVVARMENGGWFEKVGIRFGGSCSQFEWSCSPHGEWWLV
ncbi:hypothetical protein [Salipaludibacillus keqinensis]|nr:hypothetical protein [Salipaludibacillus keqinensis]